MRRRLFFLTLLIVVMFSYFVNGLYKHNVFLAKEALQSNVKYAVEPLSVTGRILDFDLKSKSAVIGVDTLDGEPIREKWRVRFKTIETLEQLVDHSTFKIAFTVNRNQYQYTNAKNMYAFDYDQYLFSNGISRQYQVLSVDDAEESNWFSLAQIRLKIRLKINQFLSLSLNESTYGFLKALLLGDKDTFDAYEHYKQLGLAHIFAISGLHFGLIHRGLKQVLFIPYPKVKTLFIVLLMSILLLIIGNGYSAQRAFLMMLYSEGCFLMKRKHDLLTSLSFSLMIILMLEPAAILNSGLHLSYYAYICVSVIYKKLFRKPFKNKLFESMRFSLAIQIMLLPATLYYFQTANLFGFLANFLAVPLIGIILPMALAFVLAGIINIQALTDFMATVLEWCVHGFSWLATKMPLNMGAFVGFKKSDFYGLLLLLSFVALIMVFWSLFDRRHLLFKYGVPVLIGCVLFYGAFDRLKTQITFFDVGHGDMSLIQVGDYTVLIDTGDGKSSVTETLHARGIHKIDSLVLSHAHQDHIGDLENLIVSMRIGTLYVNESTYESVKVMLENYTGVVQVLDQPVELTVNPIVGESSTLSFIPVLGNNASNDPNDDAIAVKFEHKNITGYFLGDLSTQATDHLLNKYPPDQKANFFIKTPHHGSKTSLNLPLYGHTNLKLAVTSHSTKYNMPHSEVESGLLSNKVLHCTTYSHGEINLIIKNKQIEIKRYLQPISLFNSALLLN